jgi:hypothetical protein
MSEAIRFSPNLIRAWTEAAGKTLRVCIGELVDNAADAGARSITIDIERDTIVIEDNGAGFKGTPQEAVDRFLTYGESYGRDGRLGRWGIGLKEGAAWIASRLEILSSGDGEHGIRIVADWDRMIRARSFECDKVESVPMRNIGTYICLTGVRPKRVALNQKRALKIDLTRTYAPGLRHGLIALHYRDGPGLPEQLVAAPRPAFRPGKTREFAGFLVRREFRVFCGLLESRKDFHEHSGWHFCYGPRVLKSVTAKLSGFYGEVILIEKKPRDWCLDRHKLDFEEREELMENPLFPEVEELLNDLARRRSIELEQTAIVNANIAAAFAELQQRSAPAAVEERDERTEGGQRTLEHAAIVDGERTGNVKKHRRNRPPGENLASLKPEVRWVDHEPDAPIGRCEINGEKADISVNLASTPLTL